MNSERPAYGRQDTSLRFPACIPDSRRDSRRYSKAGRKQARQSGKPSSGDFGPEKVLFRRAGISQTKRLRALYTPPEKRRPLSEKKSAENKAAPRLSPQMQRP